MELSGVNLFHGSFINMEMKMGNLFINFNEQIDRLFGNGVRNDFGG